MKMQAMDVFYAPVLAIPGKGPVPECLCFSYLLLTDFLQKNLILKAVLWDQAWQISD